MTYTINQNPDFKSLEISFDCKPSEAVRAALKDLRFRWHSVKKVWYGYATEEQTRAAIEGNPIEGNKAPAKKAEKLNKYGVKVGDIFHASWGYDQTNNDFFQVVELVGKESVRVREVCLPIASSEATGPDAEDRVYTITRELHQPCSSSVFIKDQECGDVKRLKSYADDGISNPLFKLSSFANAYFCSGDSIKVYESWYA